LCHNRDGDGLAHSAVAVTLDGMRQSHVAGSQLRLSLAAAAIDNVFHFLRMIVHRRPLALTHVHHLFGIGYRNT
jgi:hypothetical protein